MSRDRPSRQKIHRAGVTAQSTKQRRFVIKFRQLAQVAFEFARSVDQQIVDG